MSRRPDTMGSWTGPLDTENQDIIHSQCQEQAGEGVDSVLYKHRRLIGHNFSSDGLIAMFL